MVPVGVVTVTPVAPGVLAAGMVAVTSEEDTDLTSVAAIAPKWTAVTPARPLPTMVAVPPPARVEESGVMEEMAGWDAVLEHRNPVVKIVAVGVPSPVAML